MALTNAYCTAEQVLAELSNPPGGDRAVRIERAINSASRMIDRRTGRRFWQDSTVQTREFYPDDEDELESMPGQVLDISTTTGLIVKIDTGDDGTFATTLTRSTHYVLTPPNAEDDGMPYTGIKIVDNTYYFPDLERPSVQVTAKFGFASVPADIEQACIAQALHLYGSKSYGESDIIGGRSAWDATALALVEPFVLSRVG